jgi:hypothetical protein
MKDTAKTLPESFGDDAAALSTRRNFFTGLPFAAAMLPLLAHDDDGSAVTPTGRNRLSTARRLINRVRKAEQAEIEVCARYSAAWDAEHAELVGRLGYEPETPEDRRQRDPVLLARTLELQDEFHAAVRACGAARFDLRQFVLECHGIDDLPPIEDADPTYSLAVDEPRAYAVRIDGMLLIALAAWNEAEQDLAIVPATEVIDLTA